MNNLITINKQQLPIKEYNGKRVITFKEIDKVHGRTPNTARRNFNSNKSHFIEGVDYFVRNSYEAKNEFGIVAPNGLILITKTGYLMLAKSFTDDLAWNVQRKLVNSYFRKSATKTAPPEPEQLTLETSGYFYFPKTLRGEPVVTLLDIECFTGIRTHTVSWYLKRYGRLNEDYYLINKDLLVEYKRENPGVAKLSSTVLLVSRTGCELIARAYNCSARIPKLIEEKKTENPPKEYAVIIGDKHFEQKIAQIRNQLIAVSVLLDGLSRHNIEMPAMLSRLDTLSEMGSDLGVNLRVLRYEKIKTTTEYKW